MTERKEKQEARPDCMVFSAHSMAQAQKIGILTVKGGGDFLGANTVV